MVLNCEVWRKQQISYLLLLFFFLPKLDDDPAPWIEKLISISNDGFWRTGWMYARIQGSLTLSCNGRFTLFGYCFSAASHIQGSTSFLLLSLFLQVVLC